MTQRAVLLEALASTPADIGRLVRGLHETGAVWRAGGGWSCYDVVAHLRHIEPLYLARLQRIVVEDEPTVAALYPDESAQERMTPVASLCGTFCEARKVTLDWLREITPADWQRPAIHETKGRTTLRLLVQDLVAHDIEHTAQLAAILGQWRQAPRRDAGDPRDGR
jgi:uncharacterized damage-inducible protein DinB